MFNRLRSFPEWHDMNDCIDSAANFSAKKKIATEEASGDGFVEFTRKQPEKVSDTIFKIDEKQKLLNNPMMSNDNALGQMKVDLVKLQVLNDDMKNKTKNFNRIRETSVKSTSIAEKAEKRLESVRVKGVEDAIRKAEDELDVAVRQKQSDIALYEEAMVQHEKDTKEYKKQMFSTILNSIAQYSSQKSQNSATMVGIGDQISELAQQIPYYDDTSVDKLRSQLQSLRSEPLD